MASLCVRDRTIHICVEDGEIDGKDTSSSEVAVVFHLACLIYILLNFVAIIQSSNILASLSTDFILTCITSIITTARHLAPLVEILHIVVPNQIVVRLECIDGSSKHTFRQCFRHIARIHVDVLQIVSTANKRKGSHSGKEH